MREWVVLLIYIVALASFSSACGEGSDGEELPSVEEPADEDAQDAPDEPLTLESFPEAFAQMMCERTYSCCTDEDLLQVHPGAEFEDEGDCRAFYVAAMEDELQENDELRAAGRVGFSVENAEACLRQMRDAACLEGITKERVKPPACAVVDVGLLEPGEECAHEKECESMRCPGIERDQFGEARTMGICGTVVEFGEACEWDIECRDGLICDARLDFDTGERLGKCRGYKEVGEFCDSQRECGPLTYCLPNGGSGPNRADGVCQEMVAPGEVCTSRFQCQHERCETDPDDRDAPARCAGSRSVCSGAER